MYTCMYTNMYVHIYICIYVCTGWFKPSFVVSKKFEMINESLDERVQRMSKVYDYKYMYMYLYVDVIYMINTFMFGY
jgi:hypothetical protein